MNFLETNGSLLKVIDLKFNELQSLVKDNKESISQLDAWWTHFQCIWNELCCQQNWPNTTPKVNLLKRILLKKLIPDVNSYFKKIGAQSPILKEQNPIGLSYPPNLSLITTAYGFKMYFSGLDMWQPAASGHYSTELSETILFLGLIPYISSFIDIGANIGFFSLLIANNSEKMPIIACEPSSMNMAALKKSVTINDFDERIMAMPVAIGEKPGNLELQYCALGSGGNSIKPASNIPLTGEKENVEVITIDNLYINYKNILKKALIKIDVEGYELEVISGGQNWLSSSDAPIIIFESWPSSNQSKQSNPAIIVDKLNKAGYKVYAINYCENKKYPLSHEELKGKFKPSKTGNYLAIPAWADYLHAGINNEIDIRVFSETQHLEAMKNFVEESIINLKNIKNYSVVK